MKGSKPGTHPVREYPYFKLQYFDDRLAAWMDVQRRFESREDVRVHALSSFEKDVRVRIVIVEGERCRRVLEDLGRVAEIIPITKK